MAQELSHPFSLAFALCYEPGLSAPPGGAAVQEQAEAAIALSTEQGFALWVGMGSTLRGWALVEQGQREKGLPRCAKA